MNEQQQPNQQGDMFEDAQLGVNILMFVVQAWATSLEVFIRRDIGCRYLGWNAVSVLILVPIYSMYWEHFDISPMFWFLLAFLLMCGVARTSNLRQGNRGRHSYYNGYPRMVKANAVINEVRFKRFNEPFVIGMLGACLTQFNQPLGWYIFFGAVCLCIQATVWNQLEEVKVMDLNDSMLEQSYLAERFRSRSRN
jgi:hypothetical protein